MGFKIPIKMFLWENGIMKTTLELPDELVRRVKLRAVERNQKLKDTIAQLLEIGLAKEPDDKVTVSAPKTVCLKQHDPITIEDIEAAIAAGRD